MTEPSTSSPGVEPLPLADAGGVSGVQRFAAGDLDRLAVGQWPVFRKVALTRAVRIEGPFIVETSEGPLHCEDGWLAVDARGYPYPIAAGEFEMIYEPVEGGV